MRGDRSRFLLCGLCGLVLGPALFLCGCGSAGSDGTATANPEAEKRYKSVHKLGAMQSREDLAKKKAEGLAEYVRKVKDAKQSP